MAGVSLTLAGCAEARANGGKIPARSVDVFAARTVFASSLPGVTLGCNLATGNRADGSSISRSIGLAGATAINALLATATATNPVHLVLDGGIAIGKAIIIPATGHVTITGHGWDTGFYVLSGSNCSAIQNFAGTNKAEFDAWNPSGATGIVGSNVWLEGFHVNGNRGTGSGNVDGTTDGTLTGQTPTPGNPRGPYALVYWLSGIVLYGIDNLHIHKVSVFDAPTYHINLYNCTNFYISGCRLRAGDPTVQNNTDGVHMNGGCSRGRIWDCDLAMGDDAFGLNLREGGGAGGGDIVITDCHVDVLAIARIYGKDATILDRVIISNITGTVSWFGFTIGEAGGPDPGGESNRSILLENIRVKVVGRPGAPAGFALVLASGNCGSLTLDGCEFSDPTVACPMVRMDANNPQISSLRMVNCGIHRSEAGNAAAYAIEASDVGSRIGVFELDNFRVTQTPGANYVDIARLANFDGTTVGRIVADVEAQGVANVLRVTANSPCGRVVAKHVGHASNQVGYASLDVFNSYPVPVSLAGYQSDGVASAITGNYVLSGPGTLGTGQAFPDYAIGDNTAYLGSDHGDNPCVKVGGVAKTFNLT